MSLVSDIRMFERQWRPTLVRGGAELILAARPDMRM